MTNFHFGLKFSQDQGFQYQLLQGSVFPIAFWKAFN